MILNFSLSVGLLCFMACADLNEFPTVMSGLERVFAVSYNSGNVAKLGEDTLGLHTAALEAWTLLATMLNSGRALKLLERYGRLFAPFI